LPQFFLGTPPKAARLSSVFSTAAEAFALLQLSTKLFKVPVDTYRRLVLDPKSKAKKNGQNAAEEVLSPNSGLNQRGSRTDKSMEISVERKADLVSDPNYPSFEILVEVAGKLLDCFDKH